jgi:hypothetical protein
MPLPADADVEELSEMNDWKAGFEERIVALAKKKWVPPNEKNVSLDLKAEHRLHIMRRTKTPSAQLSKSDAMELAFLALERSINDVSEIMKKVPYWQYVEKYDKEYNDLVTEVAEKFLRDGTAKAKLNQLKFTPPKQQDGGGGGGGMPPGLGASNDKMTKESIYLWRQEKRPYRLLGTIGNQILSGHFDTDGNPRRMRLRYKKNVEVKPSSPSAKALLLMEHLPNIMREQLAHSLKNKVDDPLDAADAILGYATKNGRFDFLPFMLKSIGPTKTMVSLRDKSQLPKETLELRQTVGRMLSPYLETLKKSLKEDGLEFDEDVAPTLNNPSFGEWYDAPKVLSDSEIDSCYDINSLLMTISAGEHKDLAARQAISVIGQYPQSTVGLKEADWEALAAIPQGKIVSDFARLSSADDADVLAFLSDHRNDAKLIEAVANLIAAQGRDMILGAAPEMCMIQDEDKYSVCVPYFSKLNEQDQSVRSLLAKMLQLRRSGKLVCPDDMLDRKVMKSIIDHNDKELLDAASSDCPDLRCFALAFAAESGDTDSAKRIIEKKKLNKASPEMRALAISALGEDLLPLVGNKMGLIPEEMSSLLGRKKALALMKATRTDWAGDPIPEAASIFSLPEGSTTLAKNLADIEDKEGLLVLLRLAAEDSFSGKEAAEFAQVVWDALDKMQARNEASGLLSRLGLTFSDGKISEAEELSSDPQPEDVFVAMERGDEIGAAILLDRMLSTDRFRAKATLEVLQKPSDVTKFMRLLPSELRAMVPSDWNVPETHIGEDGVYAVGRPTSMRTFGTSEAFACRSDHIRARAALMVAKGQLSSRQKSS